MRFFVDVSVSSVIADALRVLCTQVKYPEIVHHDSMFPDAPSDWHWIEKLAGGDWVIVSNDPNISRRIHEQKAWLDSGLTAFFLTGFGNQRFWDQTILLVKLWPEIVGRARKSPRGAGFLVSTAGKITPIRMQELKDNLTKKVAKHGARASRRHTADAAAVGK